MAEVILQSFDSKIQVSSAGTNPASQVHPKAIMVMKDLGFDLSNKVPNHIDAYLKSDFDYVITVCGGADENCPIFTGNVKHRIHIGFDDPAEASGTEDHIYSEFIRIRDEIKRDFELFYTEHIKPKI